jgi:hypothetical protein
MAMLILEAIGSNGEQLAMAAADAIDVPVGWDSELNSATFDSDSHGSEEELQAAVFEALDGIDPDWRTHLQRVE